MRELKQIEQTAEVLDIEVRPFAVRRVEELATAVDNAASEGAQALFVIAGLIFSERSRQLGEIAIRNRLPIMLYRRELVEAGGLYVLWDGLCRHVPASRELRGQNSKG